MSDMKEIREMANKGCECHICKEWKAHIRTLLGEVDRQKKINEQLITGTWILEVDNHENPCTYGPLCPWCAIESLNAENARLTTALDWYGTRARMMDPLWPPRGEGARALGQAINDLMDDAGRRAALNPRCPQCGTNMDNHGHDCPQEVDGRDPTIV